MHRDRWFNDRQFRPDGAYLRPADLGKGEQLKGRAAMAVSVERQPKPRGFIWRKRQRLRLGLRGVQRRHLGVVTDRSDLPYAAQRDALVGQALVDRKSTRLNSSHANRSYAVFC